MSAIEMVARCYLCHKESEPYELEEWPSGVPEGWRSVRRGYAGKVMICPACNSQGIKYLREVPLDPLVPAEPQKQKNRTVVRLRTTVWSDRKGVYQQRSLTYLRRLCREYNVLEEDIAVIGAEDALAQVTNLEECPDGIYEVVTCNQTTDWETGYVDDYDFKLVPFAPQEGPCP